MTANPSPFHPASDPTERDGPWVSLALAGDGEALEHLIRRHQAWVYNLALRMLWHPEDAEDATQEILVKVATRLSQFEGRSLFSTWLHRIAVNHLLNVKRGRMEPQTLTFTEYGRGLAEAEDLDLPDPKSVPVDQRLLVEDARIGCTHGMLLCLSREQRITFVLGEILGVDSRTGAELLEIQPAAFRQRLSRARADLSAFLQEKCGLVHPANPCRCARKTSAFIRAGYVDPDRLLFAREHVTRVKEVTPRVSEQLTDLESRTVALYRDAPFADSPGVDEMIAKILRAADLGAHP